MSCRIVSRSSNERPERFVWKELGSEPEESEPEPQTANVPQVDRAELNKLHGRIVELERVLESEVRKSREQGYQEGQKAGRDTVRAEMQPVMERMLRSAAEIAGMRARIRRETESDIVALTVAIARRVLRRELSVDPEAIHGVVKAALEKVQSKEICLVRTHPDHLAEVTAFFTKSGTAAGLQITPDPALQPGGLVIETKRGNLDASVETQLKEIERGFTDRLGA